MPVIRSGAIAEPLQGHGMAATASSPAARFHPRALERRQRRLALVDPSVRRAHRGLRRSLRSFVAGGDLPTVLTVPVVYSLFLPFALLDLWVMLFQALCFRAWGLPSVRRQPYFVFDRRKLAYLNGLEKLNCVYCAYTNGLLAYVREVAARTEQYWCPIRHARRVRDPHGRYPSFVSYGDAEAYRRALPDLRRALVTEPHSVTRRARRTQP